MLRPLLLSSLLALGPATPSQAFAAPKRAPKRTPKAPARKAKAQPPASQKAIRWLEAARREAEAADPEYKPIYLTTLALAFYRAGKPAEADRALEQALEARGEHPGEAHPFQCLLEQVWMLAHAGRMAQAQELARKHGPTPRENPTNYLYLQIEIAKAQLDAGDVDGASATVASLHDAELFLTYVRLATARARAGRIAEAREWAERCRTSIDLLRPHFGTALAEVALAEAKAGRRADAERTFRLALEDIELSGGWLRQRGLEKLALCQTEAGFLKEGLATARRLKEAYDRAKVLTSIVMLRSAGGRKVEEAFRLIEGLGDLPEARAHAFATLAAALARSGHPEARRALGEALKFAPERLADRRVSHPIRYQIALAQIELGQLEAALAHVPELDPPSDGYSLSLRIAAAARSRGKEALKAAALAKALEGALQNFESPYDPYRSRQFTELFRTRCRLGDREGAVRDAVSLREKGDRFGAFLGLMEAALPQTAPSR